MSEENEVVEQVEAQVESNEPEVETRAKAQGFMTKEEWVSKGRDPEKWRSPEEFVEVGEKITPIMKERNSKLAIELERTKQMVKEISEAQFKLIHEARKEAYDRAIAELRAKQRAAVEVGDVEEFDKIDRQIAAQKPPEVPKIETKQQLDPEYESWLEENDWYEADVEMQTTANAIGQALIKKNPALKGKRFYDEVAKRVKSIYPDAFNDVDEKKGIAKVDKGSDNITKKKGDSKGYDDLPPEAKSIAKKFVAQGLFKTTDEYAKSYFEG